MPSSECPVLNSKFPAPKTSQCLSPAETHGHLDPFVPNGWQRGGSVDGRRSLSLTDLSDEYSISLCQIQPELSAGTESCPDVARNSSNDPILSPQCHFTSLPLSGAQAEGCLHHPRVQRTRAAVSQGSSHRTFKHPCINQMHKATSCQNYLNVLPPHHDD